MPTPAETFPKASFAGIAFPYTQVRIRGGLRHHIHEFSHEAGGEIEKQGRKPYVVTFTPFFHDLPDSDLDRLYPGLYASLARLRGVFESEKTDDLVIPNIGTIKAVCTDWEQVFQSSVQSGETAELQFVEDQDKANLVALASQTATPTAMLTANDNLQAAAALADFKRGDTFSVFQDISDAVTKVQGVFGQADAYSQMVAGKIEAIVNLCAFADAQLTELQDPVNHVVIDALKDLWLASRELGENIIQTRAELRTFSVPKLMSVTQIAQTLYGASERAADLLQLNAFDDAFAIPAGFLVKFVA